MSFDTKMNYFRKKNKIFTLHLDSDVKYLYNFSETISNDNNCVISSCTLDGANRTIELYKPQLLVCDIEISGNNTNDFIKKIKRDNPEIIVIILTSEENPRLLIEAFNSGAENVYMKNKNNLLNIKEAINEKIENKIYKNINGLHDKNIIILSESVKQSSTMTLLVDENGFVEFANDKFYKFSGLKEFDIINKNVFSADNNNDPFLNLISNKNDFKYFNSKNEVFWFSPQIFPISDRFGNITNYIINFIDITDRILTQEESRKAKIELEKVIALKNTFIANISHELRTPLNGVIGVNSILLEISPNTEQKEYLTIQKNSANSLLKIINDIIDFTRIDSGFLELEKKPLNLRETIKNIINFFVLDAHFRELDFNYYIDDNIPPYIYGDRKRIQQILMNIVGNAMKFTEKGGINLTVTSIKLNPKKYKVLFSVEDTGIGIPDEKRELIFERFTQADDTYTRKFGGLGIGLAVSKEITELMGGKIWVESNVGKGSTFFVELAFENVSESEIEDILPPNIQKYINSNQKNMLKILLAEDNAMSSKMASTFLIKKGFTVTIAVNGKEAINKYLQDSYDLILMDIQMPEMNGIEATKAIRKLESENGSRTPIIAVTAFTESDTQSACIESGMDGFISKPIDFKELINKIDFALSDKIVDNYTTPIPYQNDLNIGSKKNNGKLNNGAFINLNQFDDSTYLKLTEKMDSAMENNNNPLKTELLEEFTGELNQLIMKVSNS